MSDQMSRVMLFCENHIVVREFMLAIRLSPAAPVLDRDAHPTTLARRSTRSSTPPPLPLVSSNPDLPGSNPPARGQMSPCLLRSSYVFLLYTFPSASSHSSSVVLSHRPTSFDRSDL